MIIWQACETLLLIKNKNPSSQTFDPCACAFVNMAMARVGDPLHIYMYSVSSKGPFWPYLGSRLPSIHCAFAQRVRSCFLESLDDRIFAAGNLTFPRHPVLRPDGEEWFFRRGSCWRRNEDLRQTSLKVGFCVRFVLRSNLYEEEFSLE